MKLSRRCAWVRLLLLSVLVSFVPATAANAQVTVPAVGTPVTENFNTLASSGTSSTVPPGWAFLEAGANANTTYTAGTGSGNSGDTYSFGAAGSSERAFGGLLSGSLTPTIGAAFTNNTGATIASLTIAYTGEQWRLGALGRADRIDFQYSTSATSLTTGTWTDVDALDFTSPVTSGTTGALDGNAAANRTVITVTITGLSIPNGTTFWIRWMDSNATGSDDGLAVDDFSLTGESGVVSTNPSGVGAASPASVFPGDTTLLTVAVTPGSGPLSTGLAVGADLTTIGGSATQAFFDDGTHGDVTSSDSTFSFSTVVAIGTSPGPKSLPVTIADAQARTGSAAIALTVVPPSMPSTTVVISQVYGGGGNAGATLKNDFIEIFNLGSSPVNVAGWSVQYAGATGTSWQVTLLTGTILPGRFYLVQEGAGGGGTTALPTPDAVGTISMSGTNGKVALVSSTTALSGACPVSANIVDFVGYGTANCSETSPTPALSNTTAAIRNGSGSIDTNNNLSDFSVAAPQPSNSSGRPPAGVGAATPASLLAGESTLLTVTVTAGAFPASTGITVTGDLSAISGSATQTFFDDGTNGDALGGDSVFSFQAAVPGAAIVGTKSLPITVADAELRTSTTTISLIVEPTVIAINAIQGSGAVSPLNGQLVATRGIVTGHTYNGFFIQALDADNDGNASTSEGIFVYTGASSTLAKGTLVKVAGTVNEFVPPQDPASPATTEIGGTPSITVLATGQPLPAAYPLAVGDMSSTSFNHLERLEGMLVRVDALRVIAPTGNYSLDEATATSTTDGVFYGVIDGIMRPFREAGIPMLDSLPAGAPCCVPRFDENPERLRIDSDGQPGAIPIEVTSGALLSNVTGPMEFSFRTWTILPDPDAPPTVSGLIGAVPVPVPAESEFTVAAYNLERFFDSIDDPIGDPVLTPAAFANRLNKASLAIRDVMRTPDILGVEEVENLTTLQALASKINADAVAAGEPNPGYVAYLEEGNDVGGIDSGFLVKTARVTVVDVTQVGKNATYIDPNTGIPALLNDRPPLVLLATVQGPIGAPFPVTVIVNHLRSLSGIADETASGSGTAGARVRAKRAAQAEFLANLIQARQATERIVSVGDYNAFAVNDGYVDVMATVKGAPAPATEVVLASPDLVDPNLTSLVDLLPADEAYSYSFDGNIQTLDHVLANAEMMKRYSRFHYARNDADFPESYRNDPNRPERLSDHDMPVAYFAFPGAPTLTLLGPNPMTVECCTAFVDPGATASDADLGDLTSSIVVSGSVDAHAVGNYTLTYSVSNGFITTTMTRTVNVVDTTPPSVTINGAISMTIELGGAYVEQGAVASDTCAGALTVLIAGTVDAAVVGTYQITYTANDGYNTTSVTRTVKIVPPNPVLTARAAGRQVQLNWTNVNAAGYAIYRGTASGGPYVKIAQVLGTQLLYIEGNLTVGSTYSWVVRPLAANLDEIGQSNEVTKKIVGR